MFKAILVLAYLSLVSIWGLSTVNEGLRPVFVALTALFIPGAGLTGLIYNIYLYLKTKKWHVGTVYIAVALLSWGAGEIIWYYYVNWEKIDAPYPSFADVGYSVFYPMVLMGVMMIILKVKQRYAKGMLLGSLVFLGLCILGYTGLLLKYTDSTEALKPFFDTSYVLWDAMVLVSTVVLAGNVLTLNKSNRYPIGAIIMLGLGMVIMLLADILFVYMTEMGLFVSGNYADLMYVTSALLLGLTVIKFHDENVVSTV